MNNKINLEFINGLTVRKLEIIHKNLGNLISELQSVEEKYCECGGNLFIVDDKEIVLKECYRCGMKYCFRKDG